MHANKRVMRVSSNLFETFLSDRRLRNQYMSVNWDILDEIARDWPI